MISGCTHGKRLGPAGLLFMGALGVLSLGCRLEPPIEESRFRIVSYNVQNLFDAAADGTEYAEFLPPEWSAAHYDTKVGNIAAALRAVGEGEQGWPDAIALQEIENDAVLERLQFELGRRRYPYRATGCTVGGATRVGLLLRTEPLWVRCHGTHHGDYPHRRATVEVGLASGATVVQLFVAHWKSKLGGSEETEPARRLDADLIAAGMAAGVPKGLPGRGKRGRADVTIVAGDLNERCDEWSAQGRSYETALRLLESSQVLLSGASGMEALLWCPWASEDTRLAGSYYYDGAFTPIDHLLVAHANRVAVEEKTFAVHGPPLLLKSDGTPLAFRAFRNTGYSDHLPISLTLELRPASP